MEPIEVIRELRLQQRRLCLDCSPSYLAAPDSLVQERYNGCGSEATPHVIREILTKWLGRFGAAFVIHDWDFEESTGKYKDFTAANQRLFDNCCAIVAAAEGIDDEKREELYEVCNLIQDAVQWFGWPGYRDHSKKPT